MALLMSETLDKALPNHVTNMIKQLCARDHRVVPDNLYYHSQRVTWLKDNYIDRDINWADQQVKEFHRSQNIPYRALEGRGRPVGARNKNRAGVSKDYFDRVLNRDGRYNAPAIEDIPELSPVSEQTLEVVREAPQDAPQIEVNNQSSSLELSDLKYKIDCVRYDLDVLSSDRKRDAGILADALREIRENIHDTNHQITLLQDKINNIVENRPTIIELKRPNDLPNINIGIQHVNFPDLLIAANSILPNGHHPNIWLAGPAGTGKTTAAEKLAEVLELEFRYNGALSTKFELIGYNDANGNYVSTAFRETWEHGGVYLFDEIDGSMPDALLSMNGALANSIASFPDKMVHRHKDCIILAGANTMGLGGGTEYVGAMKQNAAFLNRFEYLPWPHDNALEDALCANKDWLARVRIVRERAIAKQIKSHLITMRASIFGASLLNAGMAWDKVEIMVLKCGMTDAQWRMVQ